MRWLYKAAEGEGFVEAQRYLATRLIRDGKLIEAWSILRLAAEEGKDRSAKEELNTFRSLMTPEQLAQGEDRFRYLLKRHSWKHKCGVYDLETPVQPPRRPGNFSRPRCKRSLHIVTLDDEPFVGEAIQMMLRFDLPDSFILTFTSAESALQELEREDPDVFTTDINHVGMRFPEILDRLAGRRGKYPVFVLSACAGSDTAKEMVKRCVDQGWDVTLLSKPFLLDDLRRLLKSHLNLDYPELGNLAQ
jgi:CheY-like chemotaxis protein